MSDVRKRLLLLSAAGFFYGNPDRSVSLHRRRGAEGIGGPQIASPGVHRRVIGIGERAAAEHTVQCAEHRQETKDGHSERETRSDPNGHVADEACRSGST